MPCGVRAILGVEATNELAVLLVLDHRAIRISVEHDEMILRVSATLAILSNVTCHRIPLDNAVGGREDSGSHVLEDR